MSNRVTLEQVEQLVAQLSLQEQLQLVAYIAERLTVRLPVVPVGEGKVEQMRQERLRLAEELLAEVASIEDDSQGESDSAETIRRIRDERITQICQRGA